MNKLLAVLIAAAFAAPAFAQGTTPAATAPAAPVAKTAPATAKAAPAAAKTPAKPMTFADEKTRLKANNYEERQAAKQARAAKKEKAAKAKAEGTSAATPAAHADAKAAPGVAGAVAK
jgi:hypothetical protein